MIEKVPLSNQLQNQQFSKFVWFTKQQHIDFSSVLQKLYQSTKQQDRKLFGIKIYKQQENKSQQLQKVELNNLKKKYIWWCYLILNWEYLSFDNLDFYLKAFPQTQHDIEQIRVQSSYIRFIKFSKMLTFDLQNNQVKLQDNKYYLDSFDRDGQHQMLQYYRSLCKINIGHRQYRFNSLIRIVQSCQEFVAVATSLSIYIISLKDSWGKSTAFDIPNCIDMKWGQRGLYYLQQQQNNLGLIEKQVIFAQKINRIGCNFTFQFNKDSMKEYIPQRIAVTGFNADSNVILMGIGKNSPRQVLFLIVDSCKYGMVSNSFNCYYLKDVHGQILYKNLINIKGELRLIVVSGNQGKIDEFHQYKLATI